jgi:predicted Holliday junction resolvase-like endonuclease
MSDIIDLIKLVFMPIVVGYIAFLERRISSMQDKLDNRPTKEEAEKLVNLKLEVINQKAESAKEGLERIEEKLDKLIEKLIR